MATLAYADLFGASLSPDELRQRLLGPGAASAEEIAAAAAALEGRIRSVRGRWAIAGGAAEAASGRDEAVVARDLDRVRRWARVAGGLPFVRFVGLTGSLAKGTAGHDADLLVVAARGRAFTAFVLLKTLGRLLAALSGVRICLNYLVDETRLALEPHDAFTATELATIVPLRDGGSFAALWDANAGWVTGFCGAAGRPAGPVPERPGPLARLVERLLGSRLGDVLERWCYRAKRRRLERQLGAAALHGPGVVVAPGLLKQHHVSHRLAILARLRDRLESLGVDPSPFVRC